MRRLVAVLSTGLLVVGVAGCSHDSPKDQMLKQMHQLVPNVPSEDISTDAGTVCTASATTARTQLEEASLASDAGVDGLTTGSAALAQYIDRLFVVTKKTGYCKSGA